MGRGLVVEQKGASYRSGPRDAARRDDVRSAMLLRARSLESADAMDPEVRLFVQCTDQRDAMGETLVEPGLKHSLHVVLTDVPPRLDRLPHERDDDPPRVSVVQPHLLRQERNVVEADHLGFTQRPDLVVDGKEGLDVFGIDLEHENLHR